MPIHGTLRHCQRSSVWKRWSLWGLWFLGLMFQSACFVGSFSMVGYPCADAEEGRARCGPNERCAEGICTLLDAPGPPCKTASDCRSGLCNKDGFCMPCASAKDCASGVCVQGVCKPCVDAKDCGDLRCDAGICKPCDANEQCATGRCVEGRCTACAKREDCTSGFCEQGVCKPCNSDSQCPGYCDETNGVCLPCSQDNQCPGYCDKASGLCKPCEKREDCTQTLYCKIAEGRCAPCERDSDCPGVCASTGRCVPCTKADDCLETFFCGTGGVCTKCNSGADCGSGVCEKGICQKSCANDAQCSSGLCKAGRCESCEKAEDCASFRCSDGRCLGPCTRDDQCLNGRLCKGGRCELPAEGEPCSALAGAGCQKDLVCVSIDGQNRCRQACDPLVVSSCSGGKACSFLQGTASEVLGVCLPTRAQGKKVGETCDASASPCDVELICRSDGLQSLCRKICDTSLQGMCAQGEECIAVDQPRSKIGLCLPPTCENIPGKCTSGTYCYQRDCRKTCDPVKPTALPCTSTEYCGAISGGGAVKGVCLERSCGLTGRVCTHQQVCRDRLSCQTATPAKPCSTQGDCASGESCVDWGGAKTCALGCTVPNNTVDCAKDYLCVAQSVLSPEVPRSACVPSRGGGLQGAACGTVNTLCERSHTCTAFGDDAICLFTCEPRRTTGQQGCVSGYRCTSLQNGLGVCVRDTVRKNAEECSPLLGFCESTHLCVSETNQPKAYCRKICTSSLDCSSGDQCFSIAGGTRQVCLKP